jgi:GNAT superfamily N-acetyltransferase
VGDTAVVQVSIVTLAQRPDLEGPMWQLSSAWPEFTLWDPTAALYFNRVARLFPQYALVAVSPEAPGRVLARGFSVPFAFGEGHRTELPDHGWDAVIRWAIEDTVDGRTPTAVSALEITVHPDATGTGLSAQMVDAMCRNAQRLGYPDLVAPVRPTHKHLEPFTPMEDYVSRTRPEDGLPADPWLRVHARAGGRIEKVAPVSMTVAAPLDRWRAWTGEPFDQDGPVVVPAALVPVQCCLVHDVGVYVEPNVWMRHPFG